MSHDYYCLALFVVGMVSGLSAWAGEDGCEAVRYKGYLTVGQIIKGINFFQLKNAKTMFYF